VPAQTFAVLRRTLKPQTLRFLDNHMKLLWFWTTVRDYGMSEGRKLSRVHIKLPPAVPTRATELEPRAVQDISDAQDPSSTRMRVARAGCCITVPQLSV
jgi:hypothetical protein